jgi:PAS domain S-box-containing protein
VLGTLGERLGWDVALLWTAGDESLLRCGAAWSRSDPGLLAFRQACARLTFASGSGLPGRVWAARAPEWVREIAEHEDFPRAGAAAEAGLRSAAAVPLLAGGAMVGVIELLSVLPRDPDPVAERLLRTAGGQLGHYLARARAEDRLHASEERTRAILEAALDSVITMDHRGVVIDFNAAAEETFGYPRERAIGSVLADLIIPPELRADHHAGLARYLATGEARILNQRVELEAVRADGSRFPVELTVSRLGRREPAEFAGFIRDITKRREAESERRRLVKEAIASRASEEAARVRAEAARGEAEAERRRMEFLATAGLRMAASMDYAVALHDVARAAVPQLADLCAVTVIDAGGAVRPIALAHADPELEELTKELVRLHPPDPASAFGVSAVIRSGEPELVREIDRARVEEMAFSPDRLRMLEALDLRSSLTVPIRASGRTLGAIALYFGASGRRFDGDDLVVATALAARAGLHIENARLYTERTTIADTLQEGLLPAELPAIPRVEVAARYRAAAGQVGGDFYDVFPSEEGTWTAIIGDVSGKGPEAASLTGLARHTLYATAMTEQRPVHNLARLNEVMLRRLREPAFCTVVYARVCPGPDSTLVTLAGGGHPHPLLLRADGTVEWVELSGTLVGIVEDAHFEERDVRLAPGDLLLLYTDGAVELRRSELEFGERVLEQALREHVDRPAEEVVQAVADRIEEARDGSARDDVALLALRMIPDG